MADQPSQILIRQLTGLTRLPGHRQFGLVIGLAVVIALGVTIVLWASSPPYRPLLPDMAEQDVAEAINLLELNDIDYRLDRRGTLMVRSDRVHEARLSLATEGLPRAQGVGFELLDQGNGLGASQLVENARYQRAIEGELARSIVTLESVERARVHLALPRQSVFVRERVKPSASVIVNLHPGRELDSSQVAGILHMVASSVPELEAERVAIVDQRGRLLTQTGDLGTAAGVSRQLDYTSSVESAYRQRVEDILEPLVGIDGVRVQVTAEVDFTEVESTREIFDSETPVLRSEQVSDEESTGLPTGGVPGTLTNQPPGAGVVVTQAQGAVDAESPLVPVNRRSSSTRNFEVDRTIDHVRQAPATLSRLSLAVVVDYREVAGENGERTRVPRDANEMQYLTTLVREAVGLDEARGDRLNVVNASFREFEAPEQPDSLPIWMQPWFQELGRYAAAALGLIVLVFTVLRPVLRSLALVPLPASMQALPQPLAAGLPMPQSAGGAPIQEPEQQLNRARQIANEDPRLAAQVMRNWISNDG